VAGGVNRGGVRTGAFGTRTLTLDDLNGRRRGIADDCQYVRLADARGRGERLDVRPAAYAYDAVSAAPSCNALDAAPRQR
jgi:hypothetical protein